MQRLQQRLGRVVTNDQARQAGVDRQVLAASSPRPRSTRRRASLGLAMSDAQVAKSILTDKTFKDASGQFDKARFDALLRDNGYNERSFVREQKAIYLRQEIGEAVSGKMETPGILVAAVDRFRNEARSVDFVLLTPAVAGDIGQPIARSAAEILRCAQGRVRRPAISQDRHAGRHAGDAGEARCGFRRRCAKIYDAVKTQRFGAPEKRALQQIVFPTEDEAKAAADKIKGGATFDIIAAERKLSAKDIDLGTLARNQINDQATGDAAFALKPAKPARR